jgi:hypothetical protein
LQSRPTSFASMGKSPSDWVDCETMKLHRLRFLSLTTVAIVAIAEIVTMRSMQLSNDSMHDDAFQSLLSSQRELLHRLNRDASVRNPGQSVVARGSHSVVMNRTISDRRGSIDFLMSKRFSIGLGGGSSHSISSFAFDNSEHIEDLTTRTAYDKKRSFREEDENHAETFRGKKRRLSSLGFLSSSFFDDHLEKRGSRNSLASIGRRGSIMSFSKLPPLPSQARDSFSECDDDSIDEEEENIDDDDVSIEPLEFEGEEVDPSKLKSVMEAFNRAMEHSQKSQQDIHDWDRKMGLKRSHSKTMRLSSRSRKKLRAILKKEINLIAVKN